MQELQESAIKPDGDIDVMLYVVLSLMGLCLELSAYTKCTQATMKWLGRRFGRGNGTAVGMLWGVVFILIGLFLFVPVFGGFGWIWAFVAAAFIGLHGVGLVNGLRSGWKAQDKEDRRQLEQLDTLKAAGLIDTEEYHRRRDSLLKKS